MRVCTCMHGGEQIKDGVSFLCQVGVGSATEIKNRGPQVLGRVVKVERSCYWVTGCWATSQAHLRRRL